MLCLLKGHLAVILLLVSTFISISLALHCIIVVVRCHCSDFRLCFCFLQPEERSQRELAMVQAYAVREAKRNRREKRIHVFDEDDNEPKGKCV